MYTLFVVLIIIVCVLLTLVVLIQNPKGGGIASNFSSSNQIMGVKRTSETIEKATWILAIALIVLSMATNFARPEKTGKSGTTTTTESKLDGQVLKPKNIPPPEAAPATADPNAAPPAAAPAQ